MDDSYSCASGGTIRAGIVSGRRVTSFWRATASPTSPSASAATSGDFLAGSPWPVVSNGAVASTISGMSSIAGRPACAQNRLAAALIRIGTNATGLAQATWQAQYDALVALGIADGIKIIFHAVPPARVRWCRGR